MKTILLLGGASIHGPEGPVTGRGQRARMALLGVLATSRTRSASRERLIALLWPDSDSDRARHLLREAIYRLREVLGDDALVSARDELRLDEGVIRCDVWQFELEVAQGAWPEADRLYRGVFLDGLDFASSAEFEHWLDAERARLAELHTRALASLAAELGASGDWLGAIAIWKRRAVADPYNARVAVQIMAALDAAGDRGGALRHAALHQQLLATELGAAPDPDVAAFAERLRLEPARWEHAPPANGNGSALSHPVEMASAGVEQPVPGISDGEDGARNPDQRGQAWPLTPRRRRPAGLVALGAAILLTAGFVGMRAFAGRPALDANRIAILPFRTSGADSALGVLRDGLVELLALQFNGAVGPVAVDPGEALAAWHRSGVGVEADSRAALTVARQLRAGQVTYGALVGTAHRFTVTISVRIVSDGSLRVAPVQIEGSMDSLPTLVAEIATRLLAPYADARLGDVARANPEALRLYLAGMVAYRKGSWVDAGTRLFRALELDSTFVPAAYRFALIHALVAPITPFGTAPSRERGTLWLYGLLWTRRDRLAPDQRLLLESVADSIYIRWHQEQLPRLGRAVTLLPNSAEAWELLGDAYYHAGSLLGRDDWAQQSQRAFGRALMLDSTIALNAPGHLADLAFLDGDARAHERYSRLAAGVAWAWENPTGASPRPPRGLTYRRYQAAILQRKPAAVHAARVEYSHAWARREEEGAEWALRGLSLPPHELDSLLAQMETDASTEEERHSVTSWLAEAAAMSGRPRQAMEALRRSALPGDTGAFYGKQVDWAEGDSVAAEQLAVLALAGPVTGENAQHPLACNAALSRLRRSDTSGVASILATEPTLDDTRDVISAFAAKLRRGPVAQAAICGQVLRGVLSSLTSVDKSRLYRADSLMRRLPLNYADFWNYDLALAFARRGHYAQAADAARRHFHDLFPLSRLVLALRQEGRWAALAGDTVQAMKAYRHYLMWRQDPEPTLIPQRDSVRAELAALERPAKRN